MTRRTLSLTLASSPAPSTPLRAGLTSLLDAWAAQGKVSRLRVQGGSMAPLLQPGHTVVVRHGATDIRPGDLVVRLAAPDDAIGRQILLVHRVVRMGRDQAGCWFITKGDRWPRFDPIARPTDLVGKVVAIETGENMIELNRWPWLVLGRLLAVCSLAEGWLRAHI